MRIKYLLSGRLLSDVSHFRRIIDSWPLNIPFPDIVEDLSIVNDNDIVLTTGYLGQSTNLIKNHNPKKTFIFDNAIFKTKGITNFRILSGNLEPLIKKDKPKNKNFYDFYLEKIQDLSEKLTIEKKKMNNLHLHKNHLNQNLILEIPWSLPLKNIIKYKDQKEFNYYENKINSIKKKSNTNIIKYFKNGAISFISNENIPLIRICSDHKPIERYLFSCKCIICPSSSLALFGLINKLNIFISKYNPYSNFIISNPDYENYSDKKLINNLSSYIYRLNFSINELYNYLEENNYD